MHATEFEVRFSELDPYGHVNHAVYLNYLETARIDALRSIGLSLGQFQRDGFQVPVVELTISFRRPAQIDDRLTVLSRVTEVRAVSARWEQRIVRGQEEIATARVRNAVTDRDGRPCRGPAGWEQSLDALRR